MTSADLMPPILVANLFPELSQRLVALLRSLQPDEWHLPTSSSRRMVKDVASHLLDGSLRRLSMQRDGYASPDRNDGPRPEETLLEYLNRLNSDWDRATRRLSPAVLIELIDRADAELAELFRSLDPHGPALFPVAWAGESRSENWLDVAREYTEKWHHTQQIFEATGRPSSITSRRLLHPCLETFLRALPLTFRGVEAAPGTTVAVQVTGEAGGEWYVHRTPSGWRQIPVVTGPVQGTVAMSSIDLWRLVTKRRPREQVLAEFQQIRIDGDVPLASHVLDLVSMMA